MSKEDILTADEKPEKRPLPRFHLAELFPDAQSVFSLSLPQIDTVKDTALVVLDTNALVIPYTIQKKSLDEIKTAYERLIESGRLFIPAQVAREFGRVRGIKIQELFQKTSLKQNVVNIKVEKYPLLDSIEGYSELLALEKEINEKINSYRSAVKPILEFIRGWNWNDPVSKIYRSLFQSELILEPTATQAQIEEDFQRRLMNRVPPGYKDSGKDDGGIGDIVIWNTILELGKDKKLPLVFVTGEEKPDWMLRSENEILCPRFELVDEYARTSGGQPLYIMKLHELLDIVGVGEEVVADVKREEAERIPARFFEKRVEVRSTHEELQNLARCAEQAVQSWLSRAFPQCPVSENRGFPDFTVGLSRSRRIGVEVKVIRASNLFLAKRMLNELSYRAYYEQNTDEFEKIGVVLVFAEREPGLEFLRRFTAGSDVSPEVMTVIGYLEDETEFIPLLDELSGNV